jgi:AcrR family transcriptional regulator
MARTGTRARILEIAGEVLAAEGAGALSFDAVARRLGKSKQAVLYWFPTKRDLLAALYVPWLEAEAETARTALAGCRGEAEVIRAFVRAVAGFHLADLDRFRLIYLAPQVQRPGVQDRPVDGVVDEIHPVTDGLYRSLSEHLTGETARAEATAIHASVLGLVLMVSLGETLNDPLKHSTDALVSALADRLAGDRA